MTGPHPRYRVLCCAGLLASVTGLGCVKLPRKSYPQRRHFLLDVERRGAAVKGKSRGGLEIGKVRVSTRFSGNELVYRLGELEYESDYYSTFFVSPAANFREEVTQWMAGSGLFDPVVLPGSPVETAYVLETAVVSLYGDYRRPKASKAILEMQFLLLRRDERSHSVVFQKNYKKGIAIRSQAPDALTAGWNQALGQILTELEADLRAAPEVGDGAPR